MCHMLCAQPSGKLIVGPDPQETPCSMGKTNITILYNKWCMQKSIPSLYTCVAVSGRNTNTALSVPIECSWSRRGREGINLYLMGSDLSVA